MTHQPDKSPLRRTEDFTEYCTQLAESEKGISNSRFNSSTTPNNRKQGLIDLSFLFITQEKVEHFKQKWLRIRNTNITKSVSAKQTTATLDKADTIRENMYTGKENRAPTEIEIRQDPQQLEGSKGLRYLGSNKIL